MLAPHSEATANEQTAANVTDTQCWLAIRSARIKFFIVPKARESELFEYLQQ